MQFKQGQLIKVKDGMRIRAVKSTRPHACFVCNKEIPSGTVCVRHDRKNEAQYWEHIKCYEGENK